jgi:hypothetical protein
VAAAGVAGVLAAVLAFFDRAAYFLLHGGGQGGLAVVCYFWSRFQLY